MTEDIRNKEIIIKIKAKEDSLEAIGKYMKRNGFTPDKWTDGKGLTHHYFTSSEYREIWVSFCNVVREDFDKAGKIIFELNGNK